MILIIKYSRKRVGIEKADFNRLEQPTCYNFLQNRLRCSWNPGCRGMLSVTACAVFNIHTCAQI